MSGWAALYQPLRLYPPWIAGSNAGPSASCAAPVAWEDTFPGVQLIPQPQSLIGKSPSRGSESVVSAAFGRAV